jgi:hypothetical protein
VTLHAAFTFSQLLDELRRAGRIDVQQYKVVKAYLAA